MIRLDDILEKILSYNSNADLDAIRKAYAYIYSAKVHQGQELLSGEPYLAHSMEVAYILSQLKMDVPTIVTGLLHDIIEDTLGTNEELRTIFGDEVADLVDGVTKLSKMTFHTREERQAESFRKMLLAMARDIRVILIKLADRLHNMRTLGFQPEARRQKIARETLDIYAPLANRMGISWIKVELEDLAFRYLEPDAFADLQSQVSEKEKARGGYIEEVQRIILDKLKEHGIAGSVSGRSKHFYSIHKKLQRQGGDLDQIYDLIAFRVIVASIRECYGVLGIIHSVWKPIPGRFKDYIAMPKANMYQSLHTTVIGPHGDRMEVQIRTEEMHQIAEEGIAAHWKYKEGKAGAGVAGRDDHRFRWLRQLMEWQQEVKDSPEFMNSVKVDLFPEEVYVFTPKGDVKELAKGSTPIDFAYSIHTDVGNHCTGARVNGRLVPLKTNLKNGDMVEVLTSPTQTPSKDWLAFVRTSRARNKIRSWVQQELREKSTELGRGLLEKELRKYDTSLKRVLASDELSRAAEDLGFRLVDDLIASIGYGKVPLGQVVSRVVPQEKLKAERTKPDRPDEKVRKKPSSAIRIQGVEDILVRFAKCCNPLPGDPVIGFITRGRGVTVHAIDCFHIHELDPERRVEVEWDLRKKATRPARIRVHCANQKGMLTGITGAISNCEANITSANVQSTPDGQGLNIFEIDVQDLDHLNRVIQAIMKIKGVYRVERMKH